VEAIRSTDGIESCCEFEGTKKAADAWGGGTLKVKWISKEGRPPKQRWSIFLREWIRNLEWPPGERKPGILWLDHCALTYESRRNVLA